MSARIYLEGGGDSKELKIRCREGFRRLLEKCNFPSLPRTIACGPRLQAFDEFKTALSSHNADYVAMWIDSEDPMTDIERAWDHLKKRDAWTRPPGAGDDQVLLMTTCMETLVLADLNTANDHYGAKLQQKVFPGDVNLETRSRVEVLKLLEHATRDCSNAYLKGKRSFEILGKLDPKTLRTHLPSFERTGRILAQKLS